MRLPDPPNPYDPQTFREWARDLERVLSRLDKAVGTYQVLGFVETRTLNMGTATATDIGNFLCTLVSDLQKANRLGG